jgi:hypothetical protein
MLDMLGTDVLVDAEIISRKDSPSELEDSTSNKDYSDDGDNDEEESCGKKLYLFWKHNLLIKPDNNKLKYFHLLVAIVLYFDFYLTGCIMANHKFSHNLLIGDEAEIDFMD